MDFIYNVCPSIKDCLVDKVEVSFWRYFPASQLKFTYDEDQQYFIKVPGLDRKVIVKERQERQSDGKVKLSHMLFLTLSFNSILLLRKWLKEEKEYPEELFEADDTSGENYLPIKLLNRLKDDGYLIQRLRKIAIRLLYQEIERSCKLVRDHFRDEYGVLMHDHDPWKSLRRVEVCFDMRTPRGIELVKIPAIRNGFAATVVEHSHGIFIDDEGNTTFPDAGVISAESVILENGRHVLRLKYADGSTAAFYCKEFSSDGVVNRYERRMNKKVLTRYLKKRSFTDLESLAKKVHILAEIVHRGLISGLPKRRRFSEADRLVFVKSICKQHYMRTDEEAFLALTSGPCCVVTGTASPTMGGKLNRTTLKLAKLGFLMLKPERRRPGAYVINWDWVDDQLAAQAGMKASSKTKEHALSTTQPSPAKRSWATLQIPTET